MVFSYSDVCIIGDAVCIGCCARKLGSREEIIRAVTKNTKDFFEIKDMHEFKERYFPGDVHGCGLCRNLIFIEKSIVCPLHPGFNKKGDTSDKRFGHCDTLYLCKTAYVYNSWPEKKKYAFRRFIKQKNYDWYTFSRRMDDGTLLKEFETRQ